MYSSSRAAYPHVLRAMYEYSRYQLLVDMIFQNSLLTGAYGLCPGGVHGLSVPGCGGGAGTPTYRVPFSRDKGSIFGWMTVIWGSFLEDSDSQTFFFRALAKSMRPCAVSYSTVQCSTWWSVRFFKSSSPLRPRENGQPTRDRWLMVAFLTGIEGEIGLFIHNLGGPWEMTVQPWCTVKTRHVFSGRLGTAGS